jgi:hypothetical protein
MSDFGDGDGDGDGDGGDGDGDGDGTAGDGDGGTTSGYNPQSNSPDHVSSASSTQAGQQNIINSVGTPDSVYLRYNSQTGVLDVVNSTTGTSAELATGYAGNGAGLNNPSDQFCTNIGPPPTGTWQIGASTSSATMGPDILPLSPVNVPGNNRTGLYIHGDNSNQNYTASTGCIILNAPTRAAITASGISTLVVN